MADLVKPDAEGAAEKAYAEAASKVEPVRPAPVAAKPEPKPAVKAPKVAAKPAPKAAAPAKPAKPVVAKPAPIKTKTTVKPAAPAAPKAKDTPKMTTTADITTKIQDAVKDATAKAKTFAEKGQANLGEMGEFAKGNAEAMVESTKILASGLQEMGKAYVEDAKTAFETMTADVKELASAKTPTEFFEKQTAILKKNFDAAVAKSSKSSEAMLKLANEAFQPLSTRVSLAIEKARKAA